MRGNAEIIAALNGLLGAELAAMDQYFIHSKMYEDWGFTRLQERIAHEFEDEKGHAEALIERILFLEGTPDMSSRSAINIGSDVPGMLQSDLNIELEVGDALKDAIASCESARDFVTRTILVQLLDDTETDHEHWLRQQLGLIELVGLENYLQSQT